MAPTPAEISTQLKELGLALQDLNIQSLQDQIQLKQAYEFDAEKINSLIEKNPKNELLKYRKDELDEKFKKIFEELMTNKKDAEQKIKIKLHALVTNETNEVDYLEFKKEFGRSLSVLDAALKSQAHAVNKDIDSNVLLAVQQVDVIVFNTINELAKKDILVNIAQAKVALMLRLCPFVNYDMEKTKIIADDLISNISAAYMATKKVSFEILAKNLEKDLNINPEDNLFVLLLNAIKEPCGEYIRHKEFLYTNLYNAKKLEFQQYLRKGFHTKIVNQDNARIQIEQNMLEHLIKAKDPKDFYLTIVKLGIEEMKAKRKALEEKDEKCLEDFKLHRQEVLAQMNDELRQDILKFYVENAMSPLAIKMLNLPEVQTMYLKIASSGYVPQINDKAEYYSLDTKSVLKALDDEEKRLHKSLRKAESTESTVVRAVPKYDLYKARIERHSNIRAFQTLIRFERDPKILSQLKKDIESDTSAKDYIDVINARLQELTSSQNIHRQFAQAKQLPSTPTDISPERMILTR